MLRVLALAAAVVAALWFLLTRRNQGEADVSAFDSSAGYWPMPTFDVDDETTIGTLDVSTWAESIRDFEGWSSGSRSQRNNNPGNIKHYLGLSGAIGADKDGFAIFPSEQAGMAALTADLQAKVRKYPDWSLLDIMRRYLGGKKGVDPPKKEGNAHAYASAVASDLGVSVNSTLKEVFG